MICSCCGYEIEGKPYPIENGQKYVCEKCWNNPEMFFPEKIGQDKRLKVLSEMAQQKDNQNGSVEVKVIKLVQKEIDMYVGKMRVDDILSLYELDKFKDEELEGYQRERYEERTSELVEYLEKCSLAIMPALLISLREPNFVSHNGEMGILRIVRRKGSLWIIDGQHRIGGFAKIRDKFVFSKTLDHSLFSDLMNYEFPVVFVDSNGAAEKIQKKESEHVGELSAQDIERMIFFIVNKTQRGISPSLKDALMYSIRTSGIKGLPLVDKENWRILGAQIGIILNSKDNSPLRGKINVSGRRNSGKPVQLNSFVSSLETLFKDKQFSDLPNDDKICFLEAYWSSIRALLPEAFESKEKPKEDGEEFGKRFSSNIGKKIDTKKKSENDKDKRKYLLLTALGIHSVHRLAKDVLHSALREGFDFRRAEILKEKLDSIRFFDWKAETSPLSALGGMKGVSKAYDILSEALGIEKYSPVAEQSLEDHTEEAHR